MTSQPMSQWERLVDTNPVAHLLWSYAFTAKRIYKNSQRLRRLNAIVHEHTPFSDEWGDNKPRCIQCEVVYPCKPMKKAGFKSLGELIGSGIYRPSRTGVLHS